MLVVLRGRSKVLMPPSLPSPPPQDGIQVYQKVTLTISRAFPGISPVPIILVGGQGHWDSWVFRSSTQHNLELLVQRNMHKATRSPVVKCLAAFDPFHPKTSMHILHTVPYTFPEALMRRICFIIKNFSSWWPFPLFSWP